MRQDDEGNRLGFLFGWRGLPTRWDKKAIAIAVALVLVWVTVGVIYVAAADAAPQRMTKQQRAQDRKNMAELRARARAHPAAATRKKASVEFVKRGTVARTAQANAGGCKASAGWIPQRNFTPPGASNAIIMHWANSSGCYVPIPPGVIIWISSTMVDPRGFQDPDTDAGYPVADVAGTTQGPQGTWQMNNIVRWALGAGWTFTNVRGFCAGSGTSVVTCWYNHVIPIFMP